MGGGDLGFVKVVLIERKNLWVNEKTCVAVWIVCDLVMGGICKLE